MKTALLFFLIFITSTSLTAQDESDLAQYEHILLFDATFDIKKDCSMEITEKIVVYANGFLIKHGIYRDIPLLYEYQGGVTEVDFEIVSLKRDGQAEDLKVENRENGKRIYFGSEAIILPTGSYTYEFKYRVNHVLRFLKKQDEIYWNANGTGWDFWIDTLKAHVKLPAGIKFNKFKAYTGRYGKSNSNYTSKQISDNELLFVNTIPFASGENLTFAASWDKNKLTYPTAAEELLYWIKSHLLGLFCGFVLLFIFLRSFILWRKYGVDPKPGTIMPQYEAPEGFSPAELRAIMKRGSVDGTSFTAELISIAVKGWMSIKNDDENSRRKKYTFTKLEDAKKPLSKTEQLVFNKIMSNSGQFTFTEGTYSTRLDKGLELLKVKMHEFHGETYRKYNTLLSMKQYGYLAVAIILSFGIKYFFGGHGLFIAGLAFFGIGISALFGYLLEQPTKEGRRILDHIAGMKMYISYAEKDQINFHNPPTMDFTHFEQMLPYAIAFDLAKDWENKFESDVLTTGYSHAGWYMATGGALMFSASSFDSLSSSISSASVPPSSTSGGSSGGGGFSSGGGFSGGGGGGGGGGGW